MHLIVEAMLHYLPDDLQVVPKPGQTILEASLEAGIPAAHACGGHARCSTCRVLILDGLNHCSARTPEEETLSRHLHFDCSTRLACQTRISGNVRLRRLVLDSEDLALASQSARATHDTASGEEKTLAILFADIAGFTTFSESLLPYDVIHSLNRYYLHIGEVIARHGGQINNYAGDGLMALFGLEGNADPVLAATSAGLEMLETVERLRPYFQDVYRQSFSIRIGIHFGPVVVGSVGFGPSQQMTVIGDAVNFASRVEAANKKFGTRILLSKAAHEAVKQKLEAKRHPAIKIRGKSGRHSLYEPLKLVPAVNEVIPVNKVPPREASAGEPRV